MQIAVPADVRLLDAGLEPSAALAAFSAVHTASGGIASFSGQVRPDEAVEALELSHYEPLTLPEMERLVGVALERWPLDGVLAWHRVGQMVLGDPIVLVAAASKHRRDAIEAVDFLMDHLKSAAWFWKREKRADGWHWIEPRDADYADRARWTD